MECEEEVVSVFNECRECGWKLSVVFFQAITDGAPTVTLLMNFGKEVKSTGLTHNDYVFI